MSYFEGQEDAWFANDCKGEIDSYPSEPAQSGADRTSERPYLTKVRTTVGRSRATLAITKIEEFAAWAIADGFTREPTKGFYEVLRLRYPGQAPYIFFTKSRAQHASSQAEGTQLVKRWLRNRNQRAA